MSVIQEALKRAQYNYSGKKSLPQAPEEPGREPAIPVHAEAIDFKVIAKKINIIIYVIVLLALVTGFGIRVLFSKMVAVDKEKNLEKLTAPVQEIMPDKVPLAISSESVGQAPGKLLALGSSRQENQTPNLVLNGIMYVEENPKAIINGTVVRAGDVINGATVTSITKNRVLLKYNNSDNQIEMALKLKE